MHAHPVLMTSGTLAKVLGCDRATVVRWTRKGKLPKHAIGNFYYWPAVAETLRTGKVPEVDIGAEFRKFERNSHDLIDLASRKK